jgi:hypothetical protein
MWNTDRLMCPLFCLRVMRFVSGVYLNFGDSETFVAELSAHVINNWLMQSRHSIELFQPAKGKGKAQSNGVPAARSQRTDCHATVAPHSVRKAQSRSVPEPSKQRRPALPADLFIRPVASGQAGWTRRIVFRVHLCAAVVEQGMLELLPDEALACST